MNQAITPSAQSCTPTPTPQSASDATLRIKLSDSPVLQRAQRALRKHFTRVWPTRRLALCPPAHAGLFESDALDVPAMLTRCASPKVLVVFLPADFAPHLAALAQMTPAVCVHADISLARQRAYLSWSATCQPGRLLPLTLWVELESVMKTMLECRRDDGSLSLSVVFVAGSEVAIGCIEGDFSARFERALAAAACPVTGTTEAERVKAQAKAANYGEQPWLHMRYELRNENRRLAVNWAPVVRMYPNLAVAD